jgi:DNA polymerase III subunit epsilon
MHTGLFYDTETTGLPLFSEPSEDPRQPHIVQIGACLIDMDTRETISEIDLIVRPDGWTIPDDVAAIHGITTERALAVGVAETMAVGLFMELWDTCDFRVGHNESFDARIMRIALMRHGTRPQEEADAWKAGKAQCTQLLATPILKLPPTEKMRAAGRFHHKSANLREAYQHFMGKPLVGAHSAMADARACAEVYFAIRGTAAQPTTTESPQ